MQTFEERGERHRTSLPLVDGDYTQLEQVLTDFWFNHFNIYLDKGADRYLGEDPAQ